MALQGVSAEVINEESVTLTVVRDGESEQVVLPIDEGQEVFDSLCFAMGVERDIDQINWSERDRAVHQLAASLRHCRPALDALADDTVWAGAVAELRAAGIN